MRTVLVTGPIGSGKSEVCKYLASKGLPVYDCDSKTKALYDKVPGLRTRIEEALGIEWSEIRIIFTDSAKREKLESIVYPLLVEDIKGWKAELESTGTPLAFMESAIALDKPLLDGLYDEVLLVNAPLELRGERNADVAARDALQNFDEAKVDHRIENDSDLAVLHAKVEQLLGELSPA